MGARRRCCCERGCPIFEDDFNRPNSTNIGQWKEYWTDSEIRGNALFIPHGGLVATVKSHPVSGDLGQTGVVAAKALDLQPGKIFQLAINLYEDPSTGVPVYLYGQVECKTGGVAVISISGSTGSVTTTYSPGQPLDMSLCRSEHGLYFDPGFTGTIWSCQPDNGGRKAGLASMGTVDAKFDDFYFGEAWWTNEDCPICQCECWDGSEYHCLPKTLTLTINASGYCSCIDGTTVTLEFTEEEDGFYVWYGKTTAQECKCGGSGTWEFRLRCDRSRCGSEGGRAWDFCLSALAQAWGTGECGHWSDDRCDNEIAPWESACPISMTCDPFYLLFPTTTTDTTGGATCSWYVEITE